MRELLTRPLLAAGALVSAGVMLVAGCGSSAPSSSATSPSPSAVPSQGKVSSIAAMVPASIRATGTQTVAADATYAPNEFIAPDGHTVIGMDADMAQAL